jgi:prepilin-type N-terminal cleavage/methylation domain-containing protein
MKRRQRLSEGGFTVLELMMVVAILGILVGVLVPKVGDLLRMAREGVTRGNLGSLRAAVSIYHADTDGRYPTGDPEASLAPKYIRRIPDAWNPDHGYGNQIQTYAVAMTDTAGWGYWLPGAAAPHPSGFFFVTCTHTDVRGRVWSGY